MVKKTTPEKSTNSKAPAKNDNKKAPAKNDSKKTPAKNDNKKTPAKNDNKKAPAISGPKGAIKKSTKKKKKAPKKMQEQRLKILLALFFLALIVTAGLIIVVSWPAPAPIAPPATELMPPPPADTSIIAAIIAPVLMPELPIPKPLDDRAKVAILMDDLGINLERGIAAINLDIPISVAIIPGEQHATNLMRFAHEKQREILIHIPMEPVSYPKNNPGPLGLFISQTDEEIIANTKHLIEMIPNAVGGNNHMGSEFTRHGDKMDLVLTEMKNAQLFFVDSLTISDSVANHEAKRLGVPTTIRDRFLDNERDVDKIIAQLEGLVALAKKNGHAIGICHPYPETILALELFAQQIDTLDIQIVPLAQLVD